MYSTDVIILAYFLIWLHLEKNILKWDLKRDYVWVKLLVNVTYNKHLQ